MSWVVRKLSFPSIKKLITKKHYKMCLKELYRASRTGQVMWQWTEKKWKCIVLQALGHYGTIVCPQPYSKWSALCDRKEIHTRRQRELICLRSCSNTRTGRISICTLNVAIAIFLFNKRVFLIKSCDNQTLFYILPHKKRFLFQHYGHVTIIFKFTCGNVMGFKTGSTRECPTMTRCVEGMSETSLIKKN